MNLQKDPPLPDQISESDAVAAALAIRGGRGRAYDYLLLGWYQIQRGDKRGGEALFREALAQDSHHPGVHLSLANLLRGAGELRQAAEHCDTVIAAHPGVFDAWYERGMVMIAGSIQSEARVCFEKVLELDPSHSGALAMLALVDARAGHTDAALRQSAAVLDQEPGNSIALRAQAIVALEADDYETALALLEGTLRMLGSTELERIGVLSLIGETQDKAGAPILAERAYADANDLFIRVNAERYTARVTNATKINLIRQGFELAITAHPSAWACRRTVDASGLRPVFVLGHPRSGNTLLENVLAMVPGASALEERPTLRAAEQRFFSETGMSDLAKAPNHDLDGLRAAYRAAVVQNGGDLAAPLLVDMDPMKSLRLPIIARLFPDSRVLLVRRDPRDVVWSCYKTYFSLTNAALDFATLEGAARHYAATMELLETARVALPLKVKVVRYEELVTSFDQTTQDIADFLAIPWQEDFRRFDRAARERGVTTASERQVRRGLFDGRRQWQAHANLLRTVADILDPWIDRLGYC